MYTCFAYMKLLALLVDLLLGPGVLCELHIFQEFYNKAQAW